MACSINLFSQEKQKNLLVGGSIGFSQTNSTFYNPMGSDAKSKTTTVYASPLLGYFITNNYLADRKELKDAKFNDGVLEFHKRGEQTANRKPKLVS